VPCAVAVERIGPIRAIQRLVWLLVQRPGGLLLCKAFRQASAL